MSFPRYGRYKDSGVEWLGAVPEHWTVMPLREVGREREESNEGLVEENLLSLSYGRIIRKDIETLEGLLPESFETYQVVHPGDIVFRLTDLQNDKRSLRTALVEEKGIITFAYVAFCPERIRPSFLSYLLRDYDLRKIFYSMGGGVRQSMKYEDIRRLPILAAPADEQNAICEFLDHETAKIDALIEEQRRLIALLKEKRQAVISHAVTKGLNPAAPMKESGISWLGKIPRHWEIKRLWVFISEIESGTSVNAADIPIDGDAIGVLKTSCVYSGVFNPEENKTVFSEEIERVSCPLQAGTLIVSRMNTPGLVGAAGFVREASQSLYLPDRLWQVSLRNVHPEYVHYWTRSEEYRALIRSACSGTSSSMQNLGQDDFKSFVLPEPSPAEQDAIVAFLDDEMARIDTLVGESTRAVDLLQERRSALISAAVSGKIDVRNYKPRTIQAAEEVYEPA